jgi:hypothetical protein
MKIEKGSKLVMIGDSITDCGRARPMGEGLVRICAGASPQVAMRQAEGTCQAGLGGLGQARRQPSNTGRSAILRVRGTKRLVASAPAGSNAARPVHWTPLAPPSSIVQTIFWADYAALPKGAERPAVRLAVWRF